MHVSLVTLFPEFFASPLQSGLLQRAVSKGILSFSFHNPRDETEDTYQKVDDRPYGGGPGMVMLPEPLAKVLHNLGYAAQPVCRDFSSEKTGPAWAKEPESDGCCPKIAEDGGMPLRMPPGKLLYLSPKGRPLTQSLARELVQEPQITLICGRYEGIDARIEDLYPVECVSVGDFVLNGGESAALCLIEAVGRLLPGFMGHEESGTEESFSAGLLEYPHYTRPEIFCSLEVPAVLRSGDHGKIARWRRDRALSITLRQRPDLLQEAELGEEDYALLRQEQVERVGKNLYVALVHYPVLDKSQKSVAVSLTNLDIHDIARSSCTFGLGGYYIVTPIEDQQRLLADILRHWRVGAGKQSNPHRDEALGLVHGMPDLNGVIEDIAMRTGQTPFVVGTAARTDAAEGKSVCFSHVRDMLALQPVLLLLGTGHGLAPAVNAICHGFLPPVRWQGGYNHLSVRSAAAIILDRLLGDWH